MNKLPWEPVCKVDGCTNGPMVRKMCNKHAFGECKIKGCRCIATTKGICIKHGAHGWCPIIGCTRGSYLYTRINGRRVKVCQVHKRWGGELKKTKPNEQSYQNILIQFLITSPFITIMDSFGLSTS